MALGSWFCCNEQPDHAPQLLKAWLPPRCARFSSGAAPRRRPQPKSARRKTDVHACGARACIRATPDHALRETPDTATHMTSTAVSRESNLGCRTKATLAG